MSSTPRTIILDGYNVILRSPAFQPDERRDLAMAREKLVNLLSWALGTAGSVEFVVVFDGADVAPPHRKAAKVSGSARVDVRFSKPPAPYRVFVILTLVVLEVSVINLMRILLAKATSRADWKRSSGRFSRHRLATRSSPDGMSAAISGGSALRIAVMTSGVVSPENGRLPASIS